MSNLNAIENSIVVLLLFHLHLYEVISQYSCKVGQGKVHASRLSNIFYILLLTLASLFVDNYQLSLFCPSNTGLVRQAWISRKKRT